MIYDDILAERRGWVSRWPENRHIVMTFSGGLDSVVTTARLLDDGFTIHALHIERGQRNRKAEQRAVDLFATMFRQRYGDRFTLGPTVTVCIPPPALKPGLQPYARTRGYPLRDQLILGVAVQFAVTVEEPTSQLVRTVLSAVVPGDTMPHSNIEALRAMTVLTCQATDDWNWVISSPNVDPFLYGGCFDKVAEIRWAADHDLPVEITVTCNDATDETNLRPCGQCSGCLRRREAFRVAGVVDRTDYFNK